MRKKSNTAGFTMIEIIVVMVISSFVAVVIYMTFAQGLKLWHYAMKDRPEWKIDIFFDRFSEDLRNAFICKLPPLQGSDKSVEFCALVPNASLDDKKNGPSTVPMGIRYAFDPSKRAVLLTRKRYEQVLNTRTTKSEPKPALEGITQFQLEYYAQDLHNQWSWKSKWNKDCLPQAVKVSIDYGTAPKKKVTRFFSIMSAGSCA